MKKIVGKEKSLIDLLANKKYTIHYYQREYRWGKKQIEELLDDLTDEFLEFYESGQERTEVDKYGHYYLGSIVLSSNDEGDAAIIDGQQRLTSLTLLLIYLNNLQETRADKVIIDNLIFSEMYGKRSFNIRVEERESCLEALYKNQSFDPKNQSESVRNIYERYRDIQEIFQEDLKETALPYFIDWLIYKVYLVEITAHTEQDAHKVFVSMNDRGLSLTPTEMLKGYLLSEITDNIKRNSANELWKDIILKLKNIGKDEDSGFLQNWLRAHYAQSIRDTKKGATNEDWDIIGTTFHKWVRENSKEMGLVKSVDFEDFVLKSFRKMSGIYLDLKRWSTEYDKEYEYIFYNANRNFTLQYQVILSAIDPDDDDVIVKRKIKAVSCYLDQYVSLRVFNFKVVDYSSIKNAMFTLIKKIRKKSIDDLKDLLFAEIISLKSGDEELTLDKINEFYLNQFSGRYMRHILGRLTYFVEEESGMKSRFEDYVDREKKNPFDIEHIICEVYDLHKQAFPDEEEFKRIRQKFGALLLLPQDINRSLQEKIFDEKVTKYYAENGLAKSLNDQCYQNNPQFLAFMNRAKLLFKSYKNFTKYEVGERQELYKEIAKRIWDPELIQKI
jgi:uncharacterized protein with ParB-like and HNH nuclease domain